MLTSCGCVPAGTAYSCTRKALAAAAQATRETAESGSDRLIVVRGWPPCSASRRARVRNSALPGCPGTDLVHDNPKEEP